MYHLSIVIPVYNEEENIPVLYNKIIDTLTPLERTYTYELIFVDDGSKDNSWVTISKLAHIDSRIKALKFTRNFGHQTALIAGYDYAQGDLIITMDCDMQDPPELINSMVQKWQEGAYIVYARRINRTDSFLKRTTAYVYYMFLYTVSDTKIPRNVGDFRLIDKKVLQVIKSCREKSSYLRGLVAWTGYQHTFVDFNRPERNAGVTGYTWKKMLKLGFDGLTSFSSFPLKLAAYSGLIIFLISLCIVMVYLFLPFNNLYMYIILLLIFATLGIQSIFLWLIGEYIARIYDQVKQRPLYVIDTMLHCS